MLPEGIDIRCTDCLGARGLPGLADESVDFTFTDPPYNIAFKAQFHNKFGAIANDDMPDDLFVEWLGRVSGELWRVHKPDSVALVCSGWSKVHLFKAAFKRWTLKAIIVWVKDTPGLGWHIRYQHEFILLLHKGKPQTPASPPSDVWDARRVPELRHPTEKPLALVQKALQIYTLPNALVCDPFLGSGTTAEACFNLGRRFVGFELKQQYVDVAISRLKQQRFAL